MNLFIISCLKVYDALYAWRCGAMIHVETPSLDECGLDLQAEVVGNVEGGKLGIDVGIDDGEQVNSGEREDAEVSVPSEIVLLSSFP